MTALGTTARIVIKVAHCSVDNIVKRYLLAKSNQIGLVINVIYICHSHSKKAIKNTQKKNRDANTTLSEDITNVNPPTHPHKMIST